MAMPPQPPAQTFGCPSCHALNVVGVARCGACGATFTPQAPAAPQPQFGPPPGPGAPPVATGGAAQPNPQPQQGAGVAPTQAGAAPFQPGATGQQPPQGTAPAAVQQPLAGVNPPTNWAGVAKTALIAGAVLLATTCVLGMVGAAFWFHTPTPDPIDWSNNDAGVIEAGATNPRVANSDGGTINPSNGGAVINGPLVVNNNGVPGTQQPLCCTETVDITRRIIPFRGPKARWYRNEYLRSHPFPSN